MRQFFAWRSPFHELPNLPPLRKVHGLDARPILEVEALHDPNPLTPSLSPTGGEGARRAGEGDSAWFMVPMRGRRTVEASHEPFIRKRQRTAALQDADALATAPFR